MVVICISYLAAPISVADHKLISIRKVARNREQFTNFIAVFRYLSSAVNFRFLLVPVLLVIVICFAALQGFYMPRKALLENIGLLTISCFLLAALLRYIHKRSAFTLGCTWIIFAFASREIHYTGSELVVYGSFFALIYLVFTRVEYFKSYVDNGPYFSIFVSAIFCYFISVTIDQRWWRFVPYEDVVQGRLEESMEIAGHMLLGIALVFWKKVSRSATQIKQHQSREE